MKHIDYDLLFDKAKSFNCNKNGGNQFEIINSNSLIQSIHLLHVIDYYWNINNKTIKRFLQ